MDIALLKGTDNSQFEKIAEVDIVHPVTGDSFKAKVKSVKNPAIKDDLLDTFSEYSKEQAKLEKGNLTKEQRKVASEKASKLGVEMALIVCDTFTGLKDGDKPLKCTPEFKATLIENYDWVSKQLVDYASNEHVFYKLES